MEQSCGWTQGIVKNKRAYEMVKERNKIGKYNFVLKVNQMVSFIVPLSVPNL